ncbi:hypothetical protein ABES03_08735 [Neobacillus rhizosphaerae]|uniref:STM4504/CBY_0614 family protein n=1 Tax=Neobacillus rhizosphaerae TaxID=2880965 RepID=UPI003D289316
MAILDIFSKRNRGKQKSIFKYNEIPQPLRIQILHIWRDAIGHYDPNSYYDSNHCSNETWSSIHKALCKEYGVVRLSENGYSHIEECFAFMQDEKSVEKVLDIIELTFRIIDTDIRNDHWYWNLKGITQYPDDAIDELNRRFQEHGIGYQYLNGKIVRVDSDYIYREAVEPAVNLMFGEGFKVASEEFMNAHEHFKKGRDKEAIVEAGKAFESVMKTICSKLNIKLTGKETANPLIKLLIKNEVIPEYVENSLMGQPVLRNKHAHGQGEKSVPLPRYTVAYGLHLCATNIVFLIEAYKSKKNK